MFPNSIRDALCTRRNGELLAFPFVVWVSVWCIRFPVTAELRSATSGTLPAPCSVGLVFCLDLVCLDFIVWTWGRLSNEARYWSGN